jgi:hypothetical protein
MKNNTFQSYEDFVEFIEGWTTWLGDKHAYDLVGAMGILAAVLRNLGRNADVVGVEELKEVLTQDEVDILRRILSKVSTA